MIRFPTLSLLLLCFSFGCAGSPIQREALGSLAARHLVVSLPEEIPFPDEMTLELQGQAGQATAIGSQLMQSMSSTSLGQRVAESVKVAGDPLGSQLAELFARELRGSDLFGGVNYGGGEALMKIAVSRWGVAWNDSSGRYELLLEIDASLDLPALGEIWRCHRTANDLSTAVSSQVFDLDPNFLASRPKLFRDAFGAATQDLTRQMVADLQAKAKAP